jgi:hypothetical protein
VDHPTELDEIEQDIMDLICDIAFGQDPATGVLELFSRSSERTPGTLGDSQRWHIVEGARLALAWGSKLKPFFFLISRARARDSCPSGKG